MLPFQIQIGDRIGIDNDHARPCVLAFQHGIGESKRMCRIPSGARVAQDLIGIHGALTQCFFKTVDEFAV